MSLSTIHRHRQLYYDAKTHTWTKQNRDEVSESEPEGEAEQYQYVDDLRESSVEGIAK